MWGCLDLWYGYDWWNGTCSHSQFVSSYNSNKWICLYMIYTRWKLLRRIVPCYKWKVSLLNDLFCNAGVFTWFKCFKAKLKKLLNGVIGFTCLIYSSLSWFIFAPLVLMAFELHSQIFPTLILNPVTTLEKSLWFVLCM